MAKQDENDKGLDAGFIIRQTSRRHREGRSELAEPAPEPLPEPQAPPEPQPKDEVRRRKGKGQQDYENLFIRQATVVARVGKSVNIRQEFHRRITDILKVIDDKDITLSSYLDNILEHHFETFGEDITEFYNQRHVTPTFHNKH